MINRLKEIRQQKGLTLAEVADKAETSLQQIQRLENGERRLTTDWIARLAKALNVSQAEIVPDLSDSETLNRIITKLRMLTELEQEAFEILLNAYKK